jgi:hypothetical protein
MGEVLNLRNLFRKDAQLQFDDCALSRGNLELLDEDLRPAVPSRTSWRTTFSSGATT